MLVKNITSRQVSPVIKFRAANGCLVFNIRSREQYVSQTDVCSTPVEPTIPASATVAIVPILRRCPTSQDRRLEGDPHPVRSSNLGL